MIAKLKICIVLFTASLLMIGCAHTVCIKVVDDETKKPLDGVSTWWLQYRHDVLRGVKHEGPTILPPTGRDGVIRLTNVHNAIWGNEMIFSRPRYSNVYAEWYRHEGMTLATGFTNFPAGDLEQEFTLKGTLTEAARSNGCYIVPMHQ